MCRSFSAPLGRSKPSCSNGYFFDSLVNSSAPEARKCSPIVGVGEDSLLHVACAQSQGHKCVTPGPESSRRQDGIRRAEDLLGKCLQEEQ